MADDDYVYDEATGEWRPASEVAAAAAAPVPVQLYYREGRRAAARVRSFLDFAVPRLRAHPAFQA